jgi:hypothetical protein
MGVHLAAAHHMQHRKPLTSQTGPRAWATGVLLAVLTLACSRAVGDVSGSGSLTPCRPWKRVPSPTFGEGTLFGVSGTSATDVWAVGQGGSVQPIVEHWDGTRWTPMPQPVPLGALADVVAISPNDAWAVGNDNNVAVVERWDGTQWSLAPVSLPKDAGLHALESLTSDDVWAAGQYSASNGTIQPLFMHWDGQSWRPVRQGHGTQQSGGVIFDLVALSGTDIWAVGYKGTPQFAEFLPLAEHWDGTSWRVVEVPSPSPEGANLLQGVSGAAPDDVWAVGYKSDGGFIERWDGRTWSVQLVTDSSLWSVAAVSTDDVWAFGASSETRSMITHWNGQTWSRLPAPRAGKKSTLLSSSVLSPNDIWAVGDYFPRDLSEPEVPLTEHYSGPC